MTEGLQEGIRLFKEERWQQAKYFLEDVDPSSEPEGAYYLALVHSKLGDPAEALVALDVMLQFETNFVKILQARMIRGWLLTTCGDYPQAAKALKELIDEGVGSAQVYSNYGYVLWAQGKGREGLTWLNKALQADPNNYNAMNSLGYILADEGLMLDKALAFCKKALAADPDNPSYLDSLGWVCHKLGQHKTALVYLQKALDLAPERTDIQQHLNTVKAAAARTGQAK